MTRAEALAFVVAPMPSGMARSVIRETLKGWPDEDVEAWHRMKDTERKREKRAVAPAGSESPTGQNPVGHEGGDRTNSGRAINGSHPATLPLSLPLPPVPQPPPNPHPLPPIVPPEPDSAPAVAGLGGGKPATVKNLIPTTAEALALHELFNRRPSTAWSPKEVKAFKVAQPAAEDIALTAAYIRAERAKGDEGRHRRDLLTLLNNWSGEVDRARLWREKKPKHGLSWHTPGTNGAKPAAPEPEPEAGPDAARLLREQLRQSLYGARPEPALTS